MIVAQTRNDRGNVVIAFGLSKGDIDELLEGNYAVTQGAGMAFLICMEEDRRKLDGIIKEFIRKIQAQLTEEGERLEGHGDTQ